MIRKASIFLYSCKNHKYVHYHNQYNNLLLFCLVGYWKIVGSLPLGMSDHCMVALDESHAVLNAGEWLLEGEAMTGDTYVLDVHMHQKDLHLHFEKGNISYFEFTHWIYTIHVK